MLFLQIVLILFLSLEISDPIISDTKKFLNENILLRSEYDLAKKSQIYVVFNLAQKKVFIKARGLILKEYPILSYNRWGYKVIPRPLKLMEKGWLVRLERKKIVPSKDDSKIYLDQDFFDVNDMPSRYKLKWDGSVWIFVRPESKKILSRILNLLSIIKSFIIKPFNSLIYALIGKKYTEIEIYLDENDSKSLFWSLQQGYQCIIFMD